MLFPRKQCELGATVESFEELQSFARERERLNWTLEGQGENLDKWLEAHVGPVKDLAMSDLANLAALVQSRRDTLMELVNLDDKMLDQILERRME